MQLFGNYNIEHLLRQEAPLNCHQSDDSYKKDIHGIGAGHHLERLT